MAPKDISQYSDAELQAMLNPAPVASTPADLSSLSEEQLRSMAKSTGPLANVPGEGSEKAFPKAAATAGILGVADMPGTAGNLSEMFNYLMHRAAAPFKGQTREEATTAAEENTKRQKEEQAKLLERAQEGMRSPSVWEKLGAMQLAHAGATMRLPTGEDIAQPILEKTGEYKPESGPGQAGMAGARAAVGMLAPGAWMRGTKAVNEAKPAMTVGKEALKGGMAALPVGALAGTVGDVTTQLTGEPIAGMITGSVAPIVAPKLIPGGSLFDTTFRSGKGSKTAQRLADERLRNIASDPEKALADTTFQPSELTPGGPRTLAEVTGDVGIAQGQKAAETSSPRFKTEMDEMRAEQNKARAAALRSMSPENANAMAPTQVLEANLADIIARHDAEVARLTQEAQAKARNVPEGMTPEAVGEQLRNSIAAAEDAADAAVSALYKSIDKEGLKVVSTSMRDVADSISSRVKAAKNQRQMSGEEAEIFRKAREASDVENFSDLHDLEKRITNEVRRNKRSPEGDPATISRLNELKTAIRDVMNNSADYQAAYERGLMERGELAPKDATAARVQREAQEIIARMQGRELPPEAAPPEMPTMTPEQYQKWMEAKQAHGEQAQTYEQGPVGQILENTGFNTQYKIPASGIPKIAFSAGDKGYTNAQAFLKAANGDPLAIAALKDAAMMRLREAMGKSDTLDPKALDSWKQKHANALRALDEVAPGFSSQFDDAASATAALNKTEGAVAKFQKELKLAPAAKLLGLTSIDEVAPRVGAMLESGPTEINSVLRSVGNNPAAIDGLRKAGAEYMARNFVNASIQAGENTVSGWKLGSFLRDNSAALEALYGPDQMKTMRLIAADLRAAEEAATNMRAKFGSDSISNLFSTAKDAAPRMLSGLATSGSSLFLYYAAVFEGLAKGNLLTALGSVGAEIGKNAVMAMHSRGISNINQLVEAGLADPKVGRAMLGRAIDENGKINAKNIERVNRAIIAGTTSGEPSLEGQRQQEERLRKSREGRATGGAVNLMALSKAAKKQVTQVTEPLLNESDDTVAHALEIAGKHI
jgi:hypothetical protein